MSLVLSVVDVDDTDPAIVYTGSWQVLANSPLQFGGGVHSTTEKNASATITVVGTRLQMFCTVSMGTANETVNFIFDGRAGPNLTRNSHPDIAYYKDGWFDSGPVPNTTHTLTVSNAGGSSDTPFQIDYFEVNGTVVPSTGSPQASGSGQTTGSSSHGSGSKTPVGAIVGGVVGGLAVIILIILLLLYRRRKARQVATVDESGDPSPRPRSTAAVTPFHLDSQPPPVSTVPPSSSNEKSSFTSPISSPRPDSSGSPPPTSTIPDLDSASHRPAHLSDMPPLYQA